MSIPKATKNQVFVDCLPALEEAIKAGEFG